MLIYTLFIFLVFCTAFGGINTKNTAVLIIDMQEGFYENANTKDSESLNQLIDKEVGLLDWAVKKKLPVIFFEYDGYGKTDERLISRVSGHRYVVIKKFFNNGFYGVNTDKILNTLHSWKVNQLIVAGINGPFCVFWSIKGAVHYGYKVITSPDLVGDLNLSTVVYPDSTWFYEDKNITYFENLESMLY